MERYKPLVLSRTFWGGLVSLGAGVAGVHNYHVTPDDVAQITNLVVSLISAVGGLIAIYGRIKATKKIGASA